MGVTGRLALLSLICLVLLCPVDVLAQQKGKKKTFPVWKNDLKYIKCETCELAVKEMTRQVKHKRDALGPKKMLPEFDIIEMIEKLCDPETENGEWITKLDMVEAGSKLKLVGQGKLGECKSECRTIAKACEEVVQDHDTDLAEALYKDAKRAALQQLLCQKLTNACKATVPPVPKDRKPGEAFIEKDEKEAEMERLMKSMQGVPGMGNMEMFKRDDLLSKMGGAGLGDDEDEDEDDLDTSDGSKSAAGAKESSTSASAQPTLLDKAVGTVNTFVKDHEQTITAVKDKTRELAGKVGAQAQQAANWLGQLWGRADDSSTPKQGSVGEL